MTVSPFSTGATDYRALLREARRRYQTEGQAVLDHYCAHVPLQDRAAALAWLPSEAGVDVLEDDNTGLPDFSQLNQAHGARWRAVALRHAGQAATTVAMADPWDEAATRGIGLALGPTVRVVACDGARLDRWLGEPERAAPTPVLTKASAPAPEDSTAQGLELAEGPVVRFVSDALRAAYEQLASDVHFECDRGGVTVKFRLDGVMAPFARLDGAVRAEEVVSRIKVLAKLDITERRVPQDGRFQASVGSQAIDLRVSIMPSVHGEDAVLRLLDKAQLRGHQQSVTLDLLGFDAASAHRVREIAELPHGMLLVTGPTGSGKTTTVYAVLSEVNRGLEKIITIEDPVEYELPGVLQIPVNDRKGLTFAKGLRSILRHDPDRILVGEIRDAETAEIAVQSALTGHQVFTTVHANSVFDVTGRFRHFGLDMFGFMGALNGVVVQRLLRTVCPHCVGSRKADERTAQWMAQHGQAIDTVPLSVGCTQCHGSGYKGRSVLAEVHVMSDAFRDLVTGLAPLGELRRHVSQHGPVSLAHQGAQMVESGKTTAEEVRRVVGW